MEKIFRIKAQGLYVHDPLGRIHAKLEIGDVIVFLGNFCCDASSSFIIDKNGKIGMLYWDPNFSFNLVERIK